MARKQPANRPKGARKPIPAFSMYQNLHQQVATALHEHDLHLNFHPIDEDISHATSSSYSQQYTHDTRIMGRFTCDNASCSSNGWSSKTISTTIRMYPGSPGSPDRYNARVYNQRCLGCNKLGRPSLDEQCYVARVVYRLKKWQGIEVEAPRFTGNGQGPHLMDLCEGCKAGHCLLGDRAQGGMSDIAFELEQLTI